MNKELPYLCPMHPRAMLKHEWDRTESSHVLNGERIVFSRQNTNHVYKCAECGVELAPPREGEGG